MPYKTATQWIFLIAALAAARAGYAQTACDDLSGVSVTPAVDYDSQIQAIFDSNCANCHTNGGSLGGLNLDIGNARANLVGVTANSSPLKRVSAGNSSQSFLFHKLNCGDPAGGARMPNGGPFLSAATQALVRDWINQGAVASAPTNTPPVAMPDTANTVYGYSIDIAPLINDSDPDGDEMFISGVGQGANGSATFTTSGITYTPNIGYSGEDSLSYVVSDSNGGSAIGSISVTVGPAGFLMNFGLSGSWYNAVTEGQGFIVEVIPDQEVVLVYWFTYDAQGNGTQQWLIGFGDIVANTADVQFYRPVGGILDDSTEVTSPAYATGRIIFDDCLNGYFYYISETDMVAGEYEFTRISPDPQCQMEVDAGAGM